MTWTFDAIRLCFNGAAAVGALGRQNGVGTIVSHQYDERLLLTFGEDLQRRSNLAQLGILSQCKLNAAIR
jgi:hypothetical protein